MKNEKFGIKYFYTGLTAFLVIAACVVFFFLMYRLPGIFAFLKKLLGVIEPVIIGFIIAYLVNPIANAINGGLLKLSKKNIKLQNNIYKRVARGVSVFGALAAFTAVLILIFYMIVPQFIDSISSMVKVLPGQLEDFAQRVSTEFEKNSDLQKVLMSVYEYEKKWLQNDFTAYVNSMAAYFASGVWSVVNFIKNFAVGYIFALYILYNKALLMRQFRKIMFACIKNSVVERILRTGKRVHSIFSGFIYGKLLDSAIIGVLCFIGVTIFKMPYPMLVAVTVGVTNVIPVFGPYLGGIPCAALILLTDTMKGVYFIIFIICLQAFDGNFLGPKILGNSTGLSAFWVVFAIVVGGGMFGVPGMVIGVPAFAVIYYLIESFVNYRVKKKNLPLENEFYDAKVVEKLKPEIADLREQIPLEEENTE